MKRIFVCAATARRDPDIVWRRVTVSGALVAAWLMSCIEASAAWAAPPQAYWANNRRSRTPLGLASLTTGWK
jgi:hypothetical protein